ncbi:MAG: 3'-5' exonuclease [Methylococcales bacterium]
MGWIVAKEMLDETQRNILSAIVGQNHNLFIHGPAGSGKSVVLVHALQDYLLNQPTSRLAIISYTLALIDLYKTGIKPELLKRVDFFTMEGFKKVTIGNQWDFFIIDEVQDSETEILDKLKLSGKKIITAGDFFQSIYENRCNISGIRELENLQELQLPVIYRNTKSIKAIAVLFAEFPDEYSAFEVSRTANDTSVQLAHFSSKLKESEYTWKQAKMLSEEGINSVIIFANHNEVLSFYSNVFELENKNPWVLVKNSYNHPHYGALNFYSQQMNLPIRYLGNGYGSLQKIYNENLVTVMTYHSAKGMDFDAVFLPSLTNQVDLWRNNPDIARRLFFVALTRSRQELYISYYGEPHEFIRRIPKNLLHTTNDPKTFSVNSGTNHNDVSFDDDVPF